MWTCRTILRGRSKLSHVSWVIRASLKNHIRLYAYSSHIAACTDCNSTDTFHSWNLSSVAVSGLFLISEVRLQCKFSHTPTPPFNRRDTMNDVKPYEVYILNYCTWHPYHIRAWIYIPSAPCPVNLYSCVYIALDHRRLTPLPSRLVLCRIVCKTVIFSCHNPRLVFITCQTEVATWHETHGASETRNLICLHTDTQN